MQLIMHLCDISVINYIIIQMMYINMHSLKELMI